MYYWWLMIDDWWLIIDCWLSSHGKFGWCGCPQADGVGECESSEFKRNLNGGPQADEGRIQVSINDDWLLIIDCWLVMTDDWLFTHYIFSAVFIKLRKCLMTDYWWMIIDYSHIIYFQRCSSSYASFWLLIRYLLLLTFFFILADELVLYLHNREI